MRVGLLYGLGPEAFAAGTEYGEALSQIEEADRVGLDSVLFEEHHGARGCPAVGSLAAAAASRTRSIRIGAANRQVGLEYPTNTAEDFSVIDNLSRGRLIFGASPGERSEDFRAAGVPWESREGRFREALEMIRALWTQSSIQFVGEHFQFPLGVDGEPGWRREPFEAPFHDQWRRGKRIPEHLALLPKPVQLPHPPIWVTAWRRETIEWAATRGFGFHCSALETEEEVRQRVAWYGDALEAAGRDRSEVEVALSREVFLAADGETARQVALPALRRHVAAIRQEASEDKSDLALVKGLDESELLDSCFLVGSPLEVIDRLKALQAQAGVTHLLCRVYLPGRQHLDVIDCIRLLASQVHTRLLA